MSMRTPRMDQIEAMLRDDPADAFLRYGLAMEHAGTGDDREATVQLKKLIADEPYVPAYLMAGQILARIGEPAEAVEILKVGIAEARKQNNGHAAGEMEGLLMSLE